MPVLKLMRTKHYIKNTIIFFPLFFSGKMLHLDKLTDVVIGFIIFSLSASCVYILNDIADVEKDRVHSTKKNRPIASGAVSIEKAYSILLLLCVVIISMNVFILKDIKFIILPLSYLLMNVAYSYKLKNIPVVDVFIISLGFLFRLFFGGMLISEQISNWLFLTVLFGTLFLGFGKRRNELLKEKKHTRETLNKYTKEFLDGSLNVCLGLTITFYSLWTMEASTTGKLTILTVPLISLLAFKYYQSLSNVNSGDPTDIFYEEKWIQIALVVLIAIFSLELYF